MTRQDGRKQNELRPVRIQSEVIRHAEGSVEIAMGHTRVICTASVESQVPKWMAGSGKGWVTAEYGMLPRSTHTRIQREKATNSGRSQEISRLIGRSLRAAIDLKVLGEKQITVDCDVIQADGGTRTAAITGGFVALALALKFMQESGQLSKNPLKQYVSAISVGLSENQTLLDLNYEEDFACDTDMNIVMSNHDEFIELQGTAENGSFNQKQLDQLLELAKAGCCNLFKIQAEVIGSYFPLK